jgi:hypothetical protein
MLFLFKLYITKTNYYSPQHFISNLDRRNSPAYISASVCDNATALDFLGFCHSNNPNQVSLDPSCSKYFLRIERHYLLY